MSFEKLYNKHLEKIDFELENYNDEMGQYLTPTYQRRMSKMFGQVNQKMVNFNQQTFWQFNWF